MHDSGNVEMIQYHDNCNITTSYNDLMGSLFSAAWAA